MTQDELKYDHLVGLPFIWGENDCFALARRFFFDNFGIEITNYARPTNWSSDKLDMMRMLHEREGFEMITEWKPKDLRPGDVLCICVGEANPNHFGIFLGDNQMLHHLLNRNSNVEELRDFWRNQTAFLLRHKDVPDLRPVYPNVDIRSILAARNAPQ